MLGQIVFESFIESNTQIKLNTGIYSVLFDGKIKKVIVK